LTAYTRADFSFYCNDLVEVPIFVCTTFDNFLGQNSVVKP
jgi:hypothetical protein